MKTTKLLIAVFLVSAMSAYAEGISNSVKTTNSNTSVIEANLLAGLDSGNKGLSVSSAYYLGEMRSRTAVIPLMHQLRSSKNVELRL